MINRFTHLLLIFMASLFLAACEGGISGSGRSDQGAGGGGGSSGVSVGVITEFGSIGVNDVKFDTTNAEVWIEGNLKKEIGDAAVTANLSKGQVVAVRGSFAPNGLSGTALSVSYADILEGPIAAISPPSGMTRQILAMGYTIIVDDQTLFKPAGVTIDTLIAGNVIEVSGFQDELGRIRATYIEKKSIEKNSDIFEQDVTEIEVKGSIETLTATTLTLTFNNLTVDFANAKLPAEALAIGQYVKVTGRKFAIPGDYTSTFIADSVERIDNALMVDDGEHVEIEGFITNMDNFNNTPSQFVLGNQVVQLSGQTTYEGGTASDLAVGLKIEVEGDWLGGVLIAEEIIFKDTIEITSVVNTTSIIDNTMTLAGLPEITILVNNFTEIDGSVTQFVAINSSHYVTVRGRVVNGIVVASRLEVGQAPTDPTSEVEVVLQGQVESAVDPFMVILGVTIDTSLWNDSQFKGESGIRLGRSGFFAAAQVDDLVVATGLLVNGTFTWKQLELEQ